MHRSMDLMIAVFDSSRARIFKRESDGKIRPMSEIESGLHHFTREKVSDKAGRSFASAGDVRHAYEPKHDPHKYEKHEFVHRLARMLDLSYERGEFGKLLLVAPKRSLGEFRNLATAKLRRCVSLEVPKDLVKYSDDELMKRVQPYLQ